MIDFLLRSCFDGNVGMTSSRYICGNEGDGANFGSSSCHSCVRGK